MMDNSKPINFLREGSFMTRTGEVFRKAVVLFISIVVILVLTPETAESSQNFGFQRMHGGSDTYWKYGNSGSGFDGRQKAWVWSYAQAGLSQSISTIRVFDWESFKTIAPTDDTYLWNISADVDVKGLIERMDMQSIVGTSGTQYECEVVLGIVEGRGCNHIGDRPRQEVQLWREASNPWMDLALIIVQQVGSAIAGEAIGSVAAASIPRSWTGDVTEQAADWTGSLVAHAILTPYETANAITGQNIETSVNWENRRVNLYNIPLKGNKEYTIYISLKGMTKALSGGLASAYCKIDFYNINSQGQSTYPDPLGGRGISLENYTVNPFLYVTAEDPASGTGGVPVDKTPITVTFSKNISPGNLYNQVALKDSSGSSVPFTKTIDQNKLIIRPNGLLKHNTNYTLSIPQTAINESGANRIAPLAADYSMNFSTTSGIKVTSPNGGENFQTGSSQIIRWDYSGTPPGGSVRIELYKYGRHCLTISESAPIGSNGKGSYTWTVPYSNIGTDYTIKVTSTSSSLYADGSDNYFSISTAEGSSIAPGWEGRSVDTSGIVGVYSSLALDSSGNPHIAYYDQTNSNLKYAWKDISGWHIETVQNSPYDVGKCATLKLNPSGKPCIAYLDGTNNRLMYAWKDNSGWHTEEVDSANPINYGLVPFALDSSGKPHVCYQSGNYLRYAYKDNSGWHSETVFGDGTQRNFSSSIAVDGSGKPHIAHTDGAATTAIRYAVKNQSGWVGANTGFSGYTPKLSLTSSGNPEIIFTNAAHKLVYLRKNPQGGNWTYDDTIGEESVFDYSLAHDSGNNPHIANYNGLKLDYLCKSTTGWKTVTVDNAAYTGKHPSIAINNPEKPCISYYNSTSGDLMYVEYVGIPNTLTVTFPNGGESFRAGTPMRINWQYRGSNIGDKVKIEYVKSDGSAGFIALSAPIGTNGYGSYTHNIPSNFLPGDGFKIRVTSIADSSATDTSDNNSSIAPPLATISVSSPVDKDSWQAGKTGTIKWNYTGDPGSTVKIDLFGQCGAFIRTIAANAPVGTYGSGSYTWQIPSDIVPSDLYQIRVSGNNTADPCFGASNGAFSIIPPEPSLTVISPNGGEAWPAASTQTIKWNYNGISGTSFKIVLTKDNTDVGTIYTFTPEINSQTVNYTWTLPDILTPGSGYKIRIDAYHSVYNLRASDSSNASFSILPGPKITIVSPNGGESLYNGSESTIEWSYTGDPGDTVKIELLKNGSVFRNVSSGTGAGDGGKGSYKWSIPKDIPPGNYKLRISGSSSTTSDTSDGEFSITAGKLTLISPNGRESWQAGSTQTIRWNYAGNPGSIVKIHLCQYDIYLQTIAENVPIGASGNGSYTWTIPLDLSNRSALTIKIYSSDNQVYDTSDAQFMISSPAPVLTLTSPNGGETLEAGATIPITWSFVGSPGQKIKIDLFKQDQFYKSIAVNVPTINGSYNWKIPHDIVQGSDYKIRITSASNSTYTDASETNFKIKASKITVLAPNGGENIVTGNPCEIRWNCSGCVGDKVKILLYKGTTLSKTIASSVPIGTGGNGSYTWTIPASQTAANDYRVRIVSATDAAMFDESDSDFSISKPGITVVSPNGGESVQAGSTLLIRWNYGGNPGSAVKLHLYKGSNLARTITNSTPVGANGQGSYSWDIPIDLVAGNNYKIKVTSTTSSSINDLSDNVFTVTSSPNATALTMVSPNGGESIASESTVRIKWSYAGNPGTAVKLQLYKGSSMVKTISSNVPIGVNGEGYYDWTVPADMTPGDTYKIKVTSVTSSSTNDSSDNSFTIVASPNSANITVITPNGGESWNRGSTQTITWRYTGNVGTTVKVLLYKGTTFCRTITSSVSVGSNGTGSYTWTIPANQSIGENCIIKVVSNYKSTYNDTSDNSFTIY